MRSLGRTAVQFRILGPLTAAVDGTGLALGGERQRALLALLLVHSGEMVSTERLIEQLFDGSRFRSSANAVHVAVSRLRRALGDERAAMLLTRRGGYSLEIEAEQLDAAVFERLVAEGRASLAHNDLASASARLGEALALWRGPPLAGLGGVDELQAEARRLEELHLLAEMERIDAELALGAAAEVVVELERLIAAAPLQERLRAQLMLALYRSGRQAEALAAYREACGLLRDELGLTPSAELRELEVMILRHDAGLDPDRAEPALDREVMCPFKGLAAFESSDADFFFGRERIVSELVARLAEWPLVGILGPSGIGKSSLLRAGVLPALRAGALPGSARWRQVLLRPGRHPCRELARALGEQDLAQTIAIAGHDVRIVIAIDQLEELFTVCDDEAERADFLEQLVAAAGDHERRALVLCALRADYYGRLGAYPEFGELLSRSHALIGPPRRDELIDAIERPAARAGLEVEGPLIEALVEEVAGQPGALPLLSTTLLELWQNRDGRVLRLWDYRAAGGVQGAVARIAEAAYTRLEQPQRPIAKTLLLRLAEVGDGAPERRLMALEEIERIDDAPPVLAALADARLVTVGAGTVELSHEALLREWPRYLSWLEEDRVGRRLHAHLRVAAGDWAARGRDPADLYRGARLAAALEFGVQHPEEMDRLEREFVDASRSEADREVRRQRSQNRRLRALLIGAAVLLVLTVVAGAVAVIGQRRASSDARLAVAEEHAALGRQLGEEAVNEPKLDVAALLAREAVALDRSPQTEGTLLSTLMRSPALIATFPMPTNAAPNVSVAPDGHTVAVADGVADQVRFFDTRTRAPSGRVLTDFFGDQAPTYSGDGSALVYSAGAFLAVRNARSLALRERLLIGPPFSNQTTADVPDSSILIGPGHRTVYYAYWLLGQAGQPTDAYLARWSMPSGRRLPTVRLGSGPMLAVALIAGGAELMVVTAHGVDTYDARTLRRERSVVIEPAPASPSAAVISADGATIAIGSKGGSVSFVDAATGRAMPGAGGHATTVASAVFARDGRTAVTAGNDGRVIVWDTATRTEAAVLSGPAGHLEDAQMSPDGSTLYTSALGGVVLAWDLTGRRGFGHSSRLDRTLTCCDSVSPPEPALAVSPDGSRFAAPIAASTVGLFATRTLARLGSFTIAPADDPITALAWSPDGVTLAVGAHGGVVQVWAVNGAPTLERTLDGLAPVPRLAEAVQSLAFSPSGQLLAATDKSEGTTLGHTLASPLATMVTWNVAAGAPVGGTASLGAGNGLTGSDEVAFSRDGKLLAASLLVGGIDVFDPSTGQLVRTLADPGDESTAIAFGAGDLLAAGTIGGDVELWNAGTGKRVAPPLLADTEEITDVAFDQSGRTFATTGDEDGTIKLWFTAGLQQEGPRLAADPNSTSAAAFEPGGGDLLVVDDRGGGFTWPTSLAVWQQRACSLAGRNLTRAEWAQFVGGPPYAAVCP
jgi:DNA-binding SARP family transcriptional activator/WD40 repeat protein